MDDAEMTTQILSVQPAALDQCLRSGISEEVLKSAIADMTRRVTRATVRDFELEATPEYTLAEGSRQFKAIKQRRTLGTLDLLFGSLRSRVGDDGWARLSRELSGTRVKAQVGSLLSQHLLDAAGIKSTYWTPKSRDHIAKIIRRLQALQHLDDDLDKQQFVLFWDGRRYRFRPSGTLGGYQLSERPLKDGSLWVARGNVVQPSERFSMEALSHLEALINRGSNENEFQRFFEGHPEFLLALGGGQYVQLHPQVVIERDDGSLIPDFFLEKLNDKFADICDLKLATQRLAANKHNRPGFRAAVHEAIAQLDFYRNWFEDRANREAFYRKTGLQVYRPRVIVIIGRRRDFYSEVDRIRREGLLPSHVELITYDDVLSRAQTYIDLVAR